MIITNDNDNLLQQEMSRFYYLRQVNEVNGADNVFTSCVCVSVCAQRISQSDQFKTVKATDFNFYVNVPRDSPDITP